MSDTFTFKSPIEFDRWETLYFEMVEDVLRNGKDPADMPGSTSHRAALGLTLDVLDQTSTLSEEGAWAYLDPKNARLVRSIMEVHAYEISAWKLRRSYGSI